MNDTEKKKLLSDIKDFFQDSIISNHLTNTNRLQLSDFNRNPLLESYLANYAFGDNSAESIARVLVYARLLGTSITTTFGTAIQRMCSSVLSGYGSTADGIDIEYISSNDGRRKYCQLKAGPQTINKGDINEICETFKHLKNLGRTNSVRISDDDCIVGIIYGTHSDISGNYKTIEKNGYTVLAGSEFWYDLTGDEDFYEDLIETIYNLANEIDASTAFKNAIKRIKDEIIASEKE